MRRYTGCAAAAIAVLSLVGAACGNDKGGSSATSKDTATTAAGVTGGASDVGVTPTEVKVGVLGTLTGASASAQIGFDKGLQAFVNNLNAKGGVNGRTIKLTDTRNDNGEAGRNTSEMQRLVEQDKVFLVMTHVPNLGGSDYAIAHQIPVIGMAYDVSWNKGDNLLGLAGSWKRADINATVSAPPSTSSLNPYLAKKLGITKAGVFAYDHPASRLGAETTCKAFAQFGVQCVYQETSIPFGFTDLGASVDKIKASGATYFYAAMDIGGSMTIMKSLRRAGLDNVYLTSAVGYGQTTVEGFPPDLLQNLFVTVGTAPFETAGDIPAMKAFLDQMKKDFPNEKLGTPQLNGWLEGILLRDGLEAAGKNPTRAGFVKAVRSMKAFNADNLLNNIDWTTDPQLAWKAPDFKPNPATCQGYVMRVDTKAKKWVQVGPKPKLCLKGAGSTAELDAFIKADTSKLSVP